MISIRTTVVEYGLHGDDYDAFAAALRAEGLEVQIDQPAEFRSGFEQSAVELGIFIWEHFDDAATVAAVVEAIRRAARATISRAKKGRRKQQLRRLPIYGSDGEVLAWVDLPADDQRGGDDG